VLEAKLPCCCVLIGGVRVTCCDASGTQPLPANVLFSQAHILLLLVVAETKGWC
jgi:hypothetical protein